MKIKAKILLLIITTILLVVFVSSYYTQRIVERNQEAALKEDVLNITRQAELAIVTGDNPRAKKDVRQNIQEMVLLDPHAQEEEPPAAISQKGRGFNPQREKAVLKVMDENMDKLLTLNPHIERVDIFTFKEDGTVSQFLSKAKGDAPPGSLSSESLSLAKKGGTVIVAEKGDDESFVNVVSPIYYNEGVAGVALIKVAHKAFDAMFSAKNRFTLIFAVSALVLIAGVLIVSMDRMVNKPIKKLLKAISMVKDGNLAVRVEPIAYDEIGMLSLHFNGMVDAIRESAQEKEALLKQIHTYNDELQNRINLATEELRKRNDDLSEANQSIYDIQKKLGRSRRFAAIGQMAATVAHEIGTPLHSISGHLQLLMEGAGLSPDKLRRLEIMQSQLERITASIQDILNTTRQPGVANDILDINGMLEDISILMLPELMSKDLTIKKDFQKDLPLVFGSSRRLQEVLLNIIDNAIDASANGKAICISTSSVDAPEGSIAIDPHLLNIPWVQIVVKDNGRGIPEETMEHIFKPFYTTKSAGQGTGLGLAISQEIVRSHRGFINVESRVNEGSTFTICLPSALKRVDYGTDTVNTRS